MLFGITLSVMVQARMLLETQWLRNDWLEKVVLSIGSPCTEGKHRMRTLSIPTMKKRNYLYIREVSKIGKVGGVCN